MKSRKPNSSKKPKGEPKSAPKATATTAGDPPATPTADSLNGTTTPVSFPGTTVTVSAEPSSPPSTTNPEALPAKIGRPTLYTPDLATAICERIVDGESLSHICETPGYPHPGTVLRWITEREPFREMYARAREAQADLKFEELQEIADDGRNDWMLENDPKNPGYRLNGEHVQRSRLRADMLRWRLGKMAKKYSDVQRTEVSGPDGGPLEVMAGTARERIITLVMAQAAIEPKPDNPPDEPDPPADRTAARTAQ